MHRITKNILWILLLVFAAWVAAYALSYLNFNPSYGLLNGKAEVLKQSWFWKATFYTHVSFGALALLTGAFQFLEKLRRNRFVHRFLGKLYMLGITFSGVAGLVLAVFADGGWVSKTGFGLLAITWLGTSWLAFTYARQRKLGLHREWMIRSYAACCAAISLRIILPLELALLQMDFAPAYQIVAWMCWVPNILIAEWYLQRTPRQQAAL